MRYLSAPGDRSLSDVVQRDWPAAHLTHLNQYRDEMEPDFVSLMDAMIKMAERSLDKNIALEIR